MRRLAHALAGLALLCASAATAAPGPTVPWRPGFRSGVNYGLGIPGSDAAVALNFSGALYRIGSNQTTDITALPGYSYSRSGVGYGQTCAGVLILFAANLPRITDCGFTVEEGRTNLLLQSNEVGGASWSNALMVSPRAIDAMAAPDGTMTADGLIPNTTSGSHYVEQNLTGFATSTATASSLYVKQGAAQQVTFTVYGTGNASHGVNYNFTTGVGTFTSSAEYTSGGGVTLDWGAQTLANGWVRLYVVGYPETTATNRRFRLIIRGPAGENTYSGDGTTSYVYAWGGSVEVGGTVQSLIPTTTTALARGPDALAFTGLSLSGDLTVTTTVRFGLASGTQRAYDFNDGTDANKLVTQRSSGGTLSFNTILASTNLAATGTSNAAANTSKTAQVRTASQMFGYSNGVASGNNPVAQGALPALTRLDVGTQRAAGGAHINGQLTALYIYPRAFTGTEAIAATQ